MFVLVCMIVALVPYFYVDAVAVSDMYNKLQKLEDEKTEQLLSCPRTYCVDNFLSPLESHSHENFSDICRNRLVLDFSTYSFEQIISSFVQILQAKLNSRGNGSIGSCYHTDFRYIQNVDGSDDEQGFEGVGETFLDPYYAKIKIAEKYYNFTFDYNGRRSEQIGNCVIRRSKHPEYWKKTNINHPRKGGPKAVMWTDYYNKIHTDLELEKLLFAGEVARRKVVDFLRENSNGSIGLLDEYSSLPIYCTVAIIKELVKHNIRIPDFVCFSGGSSELRERSIKRIIQLYCNFDTEVTVDNIQSKVNELIEGQNWESVEEP